MDIVEALKSWTMDKPPLFGVFHVVFLLLTVVSTILLIRFYRNASTKVMKRIVFLTWFVFLFFELGKQLIYGVFTPNYSWSEFPFQFCETPLYVLPVVLFVKNIKIRSAIIAFLCSYVFFAGFALTIIPLTLLGNNTFMNVRTLVQHGSQFMIGLYLFSWNRKNFTKDSFAFGMLIFLGLTIVALVLNFTIGNYVEGFNMFWISKYNVTQLFILDKLQPYIPYIIFLLFYLAGFSFCAFCSYSVETWVYKMWIKYKPEPVEELECETKIE